MWPQMSLNPILSTCVAPGWVGAAIAVQLDVKHDVASKGTLNPEP